MSSFKEKQVLVEWKVEFHSFTAGHLGILEQAKVHLKQPQNLLVVVWRNVCGFIEGDSKGLEGAELDGACVTGLGNHEGARELTIVQHRQMAESEQDTVTSHQNSQ